MNFYTYIAADFDCDENAVNHVYRMKNKGLISFLDAHDLQQSNDDSLACSIKKSLKYRLDNSYKFVLIVGSHTDSVTKGSCQFCGSYNSYRQFCAKGYSVDYRSFIQFECEKAEELGLKTIVLYNNTVIDKMLCPSLLRSKGTHEKMIFRGSDGKLYWDDNAIKLAFER